MIFSNILKVKKNKREEKNENIIYFFARNETIKQKNNCFF
jgi:hypothetical protein